MTGPENGLGYGRNRIAALALEPQFPVLPGGNSISDVVPFTRVRITLRRTDGTITRDTLIDFPVGVDSVALTLDVPLPVTAPDSGISLGLSLAYLNAAGDTVFRGGPLPVTARPSGGSGASQTVSIPVAWVPPAGVPLPSSVDLTPATGTAVAGTTTTFSAVARNGQGQPMAGIPVFFSSVDTTRARVSAPGSGLVTWRTVRGPARIVATLPNLVADTSTFLISLPASRLLAVSGSAQSATIHTLLGAPIVLRVTASDSVSVSGIPVTFAVTTGGGTLTASADTSDVNGLVQTSWTLGALVGGQSMTATLTVGGTTLVTTATGVAPVATQLVVLAAPSAGVAGATLPAVAVEARDVNGTITPLFTGPVTIALNAGATGATLAGTTIVNAVAGVATFANLRIERAAAGLSFIVTSGGLTPDTSAALTILPAAAANLLLVSGDAQAATVLSVLAAPFVARATDGFNNPVAGVPVTWAIAAGTGSLSVANTTTDASGLANTTLTLPNVSGTTVVTATATGLTGSPLGFVASALPGAASQLVYTLNAGGGTAGVPITPGWTIQARDASGNLVTSFTGAVTVALANGPGGATLGGTQTVNAVGGIATFGNLSIDLVASTWVLNATASGLTGAQSTAFSITPAAAATLAIVSGGGQSSPISTALAAPFVVRVTDAFTNPVAGVTVAWAISAGGGSLSVPTSITAAAGQASVTYTAGTVTGTSIVTGTVAGVTGSPASFSTTIGAGAATALVFMSAPTGSLVAGAIVGNIVVQARDAGGNLAVGFSGNVILRINSGPNANTDSMVVVAAGGIATLSGTTFDQVGSYTLRANAAGLTAAISGSFDISAGPARFISLGTPSGDGQVGTVGQVLGQPLRAIVIDTFSNPVAGISVTFTAVRGVDTLSVTPATTDVAGVASFTPTLPATPGPVSYRVTSTGLIGSGFTLNVTVNTGVASQLALTTPPTTGIVSTALPTSVVQLRDALGNLVSSSTAFVGAQIDSGPAGATLGGNTPIQAVGGVATFTNIGVSLVGNYRLRYTSAGATDVLSPVFAVTAGAPTQLVYTQQTTTGTAGAAITPGWTLEARDAGGNLTTGFTGPITMALANGPGGATFGGTTTRNAVGGIATFNDLSVDIAFGAWRLDASSPGLTTAQSTPLTITAAAAATLTIVSGGGQSSPISTALAAPFIVRVTDAFTNPVAGVTLNWAIGVGGGSLAAATSLTDASGQASITYTTGTATGTSVVNATVAGLAGSPVSFATTVGAGAATALVFTQSPAGSFVAGTPVGDIIVQARDAGGNLTVGFTGNVILRINTGPGANTDSVVAAAVGGVATASGEFFEQVGTYTLRANAAGLTAAVSGSFDITVGPATFVDRDTASGDGQVGPVGQALALPLRAVVTDAFGNPVAGISVTFTGVRSADTLSVTSATTDASGVASITPTLPATPGLVQYIVTSIGLTGSGFPMNVTATTGAVAQLALTTPPTTGIVSTALPTSVVQLRDALGNLVSSSTAFVGAQIDSGPAGATLGGNTPVQAVGGVATFTNIGVSLVGNYRLRYTSAGATDVLSPVFAVTAGAPTQLVYTQQTTTGTAGAAITPGWTLEARDAGGNLTTGFTGAVTVSLAGGDAAATLGGTVLRNAVGGVVTFADLTVDSAATGYTITAVSGSLANATSGAFTVAAGTPAALVLTSGAIGQQVAGVNLPNLVVAVRDALGNVVTGFTGNLIGRVSSGPQGPSPDSVIVAAVAGVATFTAVNLSAAGTYVLRVNMVGVPDLFTNSFAVIPGPAAFIFPDTVASGDGQTGVAGQALAQPLRAGVQDTEQNAIAGVTVVFTTVRGVDTLAVNTVLTNAAGLAILTPTLPSTPGPVTFLVTSTGLSGSGFAFTATVTAGAATQLVVSQQPGSAASGAIIPSTVVQARDALGNLAAGFTGPVTVVVDSGPVLGSTLGGTPSVAAVAGVATFADLALDRASQYRWRFTSPGLGSVVSAPFTISTGVAASLTTTEGNGQSAAASLALGDSLGARVADAFGNPIAGVTITWSVTSGGGSVAPTTSVTGADGVARARWTLGGTVGAQGAQGSGAGFTAAFSATATVTDANVVWTGAVNANWSELGNWSGGLVPTPSDSVRIPAATPFSARLNTATAVIGRLRIANGATVTLDTFPLFVSGSLDVEAGASVLSDSLGGFALIGNGNVRGTMPRLYVQSGIHALNGPLAVGGDLHISGGSLAIGASAVTVGGNLSTLGSGVLAMTAPSTVVVQGDAIFAGGTTSGQLTGGVLTVRGDFMQGGGNVAAFSASAGHTVVLDGPVTQTVTLINPDVQLNTACTASCFGTLRSLRSVGTGALQVGSDLKALGTIDVSGDSLDATGQSLISANAPSLVSDVVVAAKIAWQTGLTRTAGTFAVDTLVAWGSGALLVSEVIPTIVVGSYTVTGPHPAGIVVEGNGVVDVTGVAAIGSGGLALTTTGNGRVTMTDAGDRLVVTGDAIFGGATAAGLMTAGLLEITGNFTQNGNAESFSASGDHVTEFRGTSLQQAVFSAPGFGAGNSHFAHLALGGTVGVQLNSDAYATGQLRDGAGPGRMLTTVSGAAIFTGGAAFTSANLVGVRWEIRDGSTVDALSGVVFQNQDPTVAQFSVIRSSGTVTADNLNFDTPPTSGVYILVNDPDGATNGSSVLALSSMLDPSGHGGFLSELGTATITGWDAVAPFIWTGSFNTDFNTTANWAGGVVPTAGDSVTISAAAINNLDINAPTTLRALVNQSATAAVTLQSQPLTITERLVTLYANVGVGCSGSPLLTLAPTATATLAGHIACDVAIAGSGVTTLSDSLLLGRSVRITGAGSLDIGAFTLRALDSLVTTDGGTLRMNAASALVDIRRDASFRGGNTTGLLSSGRLRIGGDFSQSVNPAAFNAFGITTELRDAFAGAEGTPTASFTDPIASRFGFLVFGNGARSLTTPVTVQHDVTFGTTGNVTGTGVVNVLGAIADTMTYGGSPPTLQLPYLMVDREFGYRGTIDIDTVYFGSSALERPLPASILGLRVPYQTLIVGGQRVVTVASATDSLIVTDDLIVNSTGTLRFAAPSATAVTHIGDNLVVVTGGSFIMTEAGATVIAQNGATLQGTSTANNGVLRLGGNVSIAAGALTAVNLHITELFDGNALIDGFSLSVADSTAYFASLRPESGAWTWLGSPTDTMLIQTALNMTGTASLNGEPYIKIYGPVQGQSTSTLSLTRLAYMNNWQFSGTYDVDTLTLFGGGGQPLYARDGLSNQIPYRTVRITGDARPIVAAADEVSIGSSLLIDGGIFRVGTGADGTDSVRVNVTGQLRTMNGGRLAMQHAEGRISIDGSAFFGGASTDGLLTTGELVVRNNFSQAGGDADAFRATGNHVTRFSTEGTQQVGFSDPGASPGASSFRHLRIQQALGSRIVLMSDVFVGGQLRESMGSTATFRADAPRLLSVGGANLDDVAFNRVALSVNNGDNIEGMSALRFDSLPSNLTPLQFHRDGGAVSLSAPFFAVVPAGGTAYLIAEDLNGGDADPLTINVTTPSPAGHDGHLTVLGTAVVNGWGVTAEAVWTGATSGDWNDPSNWSTSVVPDASTNVTIPVAGTTPVTSGPRTVRNLTVDAGGLLTIASSGMLTVTGNTSVAGTVTAAVPNDATSVLQLAPPAIASLAAAGEIGARLVIAGGTVALADSVRVTGNFSMGVEIAGGVLDLNQRRMDITGSFRTSGAGQLRMLSAADSLIVDENVYFAGGSTEGLLTNGTILVSHDFQQLGGGSTTSFAATGSHTVRFVGAAIDAQVAFASPGATLSRFANVGLDKSSGRSVNFFNTPVQIRDIVSNNGPVYVNNAAVTVTGTVVQPAGGAFWDVDVSATVSLTGVNATTCNGFTFSVTNTPANFAPTACWNPPAQELVWTGAGGNSLWSNPANWLPSRIPVATDSVTINLNATVDLNQAATVSWLMMGTSSTVTLNLNNGATLQVDSAAITTATTTLNMVTGSTLTGAGAVSIGGAFSWNGGTMSGAGGTLIAGGATATLAASQGITFDGRVLAIGGTVNVGAAGIATAGDPAISVVSGGALNFTATNSFFPGVGTMDIINAGVIRKMASAGTVRIDWPIVNTGTIEVQDETLDLRNTLDHVSGTITISNAATLVNGGNFTAHPTAAVTVGDGGSLTLQSGGVSANPGNHAFQALSTLSGQGTLRTVNADTVVVAGTVNIDSLVTGSGRIELNSADTVNIGGGAYQGGGFFSGSSVVAISGTFTIAAGNPNGTGTFFVRPTGTLEITGGGLRGWDIDVAGTWRWGQTNLSLLVDPATPGNFPMVNIRTGGVLDIVHAATSFTITGTSSVITNNGTIQKSAGTATSTLNVLNVLNFTGINVNSLGILTITNGCTQSGPVGGIGTLNGLGCIN